MKYLALSLMLCVMLSLSDASCYYKTIQPGMNMTHCQDDFDKTWHAVGSSWRNSQCMDCHCGGCCTRFSTPTRFPDDCVSVFNSTACQYIVHKRNDPSVTCPVFEEVLK